MEKEQLSRKLAVILHADVVGSTALVQQDETLAHERIQAAFNLLSKSVSSYRGLTREIRGDALVAEFDRASDAVSAALAFQADHAKLISRLQDDLRPWLRIGIAMGEVVIADGTVTGSGVVLAQRVEQLADPGGLCITAALHETLPKRLPFEQVNLGALDLKGFDDPVQVYLVELKAGQSVPVAERPGRSARPWGKPRFVIAAVVSALILIAGVIFWFEAGQPIVEPAKLDRMVYPLPDKPSIAVLPFANLSNESAQAAFVDGLTEDLITDLSKISGLFVVSRNSVWKYKDKTVAIRRVSEELGVRYILEGSVRRAGNEVRINAQLIDALSGGHKWAERYDGSLNDVFSMQDEIIGSIVDELEIVLVGDEQAKLARVQTGNPDAYDAFVQGWVRYHRHAVKDFDSAINYLEEAVRLDPQYAKAHAALAAIYWDAWINNWAGKLEIPAPVILKNAKQHLQQAANQPDTLAYWVASNISIAEGDYPIAVKQAEEIIALDPNNADGYAVLAKAKTLAGNPGESVELIGKAVRLNPYSSPLHAAIRDRDTDAIGKLIAEGANVDARDYYGRTALHISAEIDYLQAVELLVAAGADLEAGAQGYPDNREFEATPLIVAAQLGHTKVAEALIEAGANVNATTNSMAGSSRIPVINWAAWDGHTDIVRQLIAHGADFDARAGLRNRTPLINAAMKGHAGTAELLIGEGADVNAGDSNGITPLHLAAIAGNARLVRLLLDNGADIGARTRSGSFPGETPLHAAAAARQIEIAGILLKHGADIDAVDEFGYTPLRRAVDGGHLEIVKLLIERGGDVSTRDANGVTLLHIAAQNENLEIARLLISKGADVNARDTYSGFTPLDYALDGNEEMIELLKQHGSICTSC